MAEKIKKKSQGWKQYVQIQRRITEKNWQYIEGMEDGGSC